MLGFLYSCVIFIIFAYYMEKEIWMKTLSATIIDWSPIEDDVLLSEAVEKAKAIYGEDVVLALITPSDSDQELAFRPDMAQYIPDTSKQIIKISTLNALKDTFNCHNALTVDGMIRSDRVPTSRAFYSISDGKILAVNPTEESLARFL